MEKDSGLYNLNKGYAPQEKKDLMNDNPIAKDASGGRGGSWMSKHSQSKVGGSPAKMVSPLDKAGARGNHGNHMQIGSDNSQPAGKRTDTPSEYWRKHQQLSHHKKSPANMVSPLHAGTGEKIGKAVDKSLSAISDAAKKYNIVSVTKRALNSDTGKKVKTAVKNVIGKNVTRAN